MGEVKLGSELPMHQGVKHDVRLDSTAAIGKNPFTEEFGKFAEDALEDWKVPGLSIAVIDGDDVFAKGYGFATLPDIKATPETLWYCASTSKAHTAALVAKLIDSGKYPALRDGWSTTLASIIRDDFVLQDEWATNNMTLEDAVCHRTGMGRHDKATARQVDGRCATVRDTTRNMRNLPLVAAPRAEFHYCNLMFAAIALAIETITGKRLGEVFLDEIWAPLGMDSTYFGLKDAQNAPKHFASGYYWDETTKCYKTVAPADIPELSGAGGVISNVLDYAKWVKCLLNETPPFSEAAHSDIRRPRVIETAEPSGPIDVSLYGLGWSRTSYKGHVMYTHNGGMHAAGAQVYWVPERGFGVVAFANTAFSSNAVEDVLVYRLLGDKLGVEEGERFDVDGWYKTIEKARHRSLKDAISNLFPNTPTPPIPSSFKTSELAGTYTNAGYGTLTLREEPHPDRAGQTVLVANRLEMTWRYRITLFHVSGDYWIVYQDTPESPNLAMEFAPAGFGRRVDGGVGGLEVEWVQRRGGFSEGKTMFERE